MNYRMVKYVLIKLCDCLFLLRIPVLIPVWIIVLLGWITGSSSIHIATRGSEVTVEWLLWITVVSFSLIVGSIYVVNQIFDVETDRINNKLFILPRGLISLRGAWICAVLCSIAGMSLCIIFLDAVLVLLYSISVCLGILYNIPPMSFKNRAWGGLLVNLFGYGIVTYLIGFYIASFKFENNFSILAQGIIPSLSLGFAIAAVFLTTTIPDTKGDRSSGKKTFSVVYGEKKTAYCAALCCGFSLLFSFAIPNNNWIMIVQSAVSLLIFITFAHSNKHNQAFKTFRWPVFMLSLLVVLYVPLFLFALLIPLVTCRFYYKIRFNYTYPTLSHS